MVDCFTPLKEVERPSDALEIVRAYRALALASEGLTGNPDRRALFADLLSPRDLPDATPERIKANKASWTAIAQVLRFPFSYALPVGKRGISSCGMTCEGQDARMGVDADCLYAPYQWGTSVSRAIAYYSKHGAWTYADRADPSERPPMVAYVVIGLTPPKGQTNDYGGCEHAFRIIGRDLEGDLFTSIDGGSVDKVTGLQAVHRTVRRW